MTHFDAFRVLCNIVNPFPMSEHSLCRFVAYLANKGLAPQSIQTYLSAVRDAQISMCFLDPRDQSSLPVLRRVLAGIRRLQATELPCRQQLRLPIMLTVLKSIRDQLDVSTQPERELMWAVVLTAFFGFFHLGELLPENEAAYARATHLSWGDVVTDSHHQPTMLKIHLRRSKCYQFGCGVDVYVGRTTNELRPVAATLAYFAVQGGAEGPLLEDRSFLNLLTARLSALNIQIEHVIYTQGKIALSLGQFFDQHLLIYV